MIERQFIATKIDVDSQEARENQVSVAIEASYALLIDNRYRINVIASPEYLEELATGYLLSEGIISNIADIRSINVKNDQILVALTRKEGDTDLWFEVRSSGCVGIKMQYENLGEIVTSNLSVSASVLCAMLE